MRARTRTLAAGSSRPRRGSIHDAVIPLGVLLIGLLFTALVTKTLQDAVAARDLQRFKEVVGIAHTTTEARMAAYMAMLRAGVGFYNATGTMTAEGFRRFARQLHLSEDYRGAMGYGFAERVTAEELPTFLAARRAEGAAEFAARPEGSRSEYVLVKYLEPLDRRNAEALGLDMWTEPVPREAMQRARDTGEAAASGRVDLAEGAGFLIYVPVYATGSTPETVEERRRLLAGFVYSPFRVGSVLESTLTAGLRSQVAVHIYDGPPARENLLYESHSSLAAPGADHSRAEMRTLGFAGRTWTIDYHSRAGFRATSTSDLVRNVPLLGILLSGLFAFVALAQVRARDRARDEASERRLAEMAVVEREKRLRRILNNIYAFVVVLDRDGRVLEVNDAPLDMLGLQREAVVGRLFWEAPWWDDVPEAREPLRRAVERAAAGEVVRQDVAIGGGEARMIIDLQIAPARDDDGSVAFIVPFGVDITDRKRSEEHRQMLLAELGHRVKNTLAVIQSLARQTGARAHSVADFLAAFQGRIMALGAAHNLLIETGWRSARLDAVIGLALKPHLVRPGDQLKLCVPAATLPPELAQNLALVFHELATNAAKYGALAAPHGTVVVSGTRDAEGLSLTWTERGGGRVEKPTTAGFGTTLLNALLVGRHKGRVDLDWQPEGLVCSIFIPAEELEPSGTNGNRFAARPEAEE